ncbi:MAG: hypothetical protein LBI96_01490 [Odoribacteraceae bacterium]|jgi:hypothetical protein|nr:hypothetical protein [Odoribacteraceae bacterium]
MEVLARLKSRARLVSPILSTATKVKRIITIVLLPIAHVVNMEDHDLCPLPGSGERLVTLSLTAPGMPSLRAAENAIVGLL